MRDVKRCRYAGQGLGERAVDNDSSIEKIKEQRAELCRVIDELNFWMEERRKLFHSVQDFIQHGLRTGRITEVRNAGSKEKQLSGRMVATVDMDANHAVRCLLMMNSRLNRLKKELSELDDKIAQAS